MRLVTGRRSLIQGDQFVSGTLDYVTCPLVLCTLLYSSVHQLHFLQGTRNNMAMFIWLLMQPDQINIKSLFARYQKYTAVQNWSPCKIQRTMAVLVGISSREQSYIPKILYRILKIEAQITFPYQFKHIYLQMRVFYTIYKSQIV